MGKNIYLIVMCGGKGSRLWPLSTNDLPKQFLSILDQDTLLQKTVERTNSNFNLVILSNHRFQEVIRRQLYGCNYTLILEPDIRDTAPAISFTTMYLESIDPDALAIFLPADHIMDKEKLNNCLERAIELVESSDVTVLGIQPTFPSSSFGYIKPIRHSSQVERFVEKPNYEVAMELIDQGCYWNAGIFLFCVGKMKNSILKFQPELFNQLDNCLSTIGILSMNMDRHVTNNPVINIPESYSRCKKISFDYAIMEKLTNIHMVPYNGIWSDVGTWNAVSELQKKSDEGNSTIGEVTMRNVKNSCILNYQTDRKIIIQDLEDVIVVNYNGNVLITSSKNADKIKDLL